MVHVEPEEINSEPHEPHERFKADAMLLVPGWGCSDYHKAVFENVLQKEKDGTPLVLDADAIAMAKGMRFSGNTILTPHTGEFSRLVGRKLTANLTNLTNLVKEYAEKLNAVIVLKASDMLIAAPSGELRLVRGGLPVLAAGGSGDLLAGFTVSIAARMAAGLAKVTERSDSCNRTFGTVLFDAACAAASLLEECARRTGKRFADALELADLARSIAGEAWL
jgi:NAD(P)H-hydrate epimerase